MLAVSAVLKRAASTKDSKTELNRRSLAMNCQTGKATASYLPRCYVEGVPMLEKSWIPTLKSPEMTSRTLVV